MADNLDAWRHSLDAAGQAFALEVQAAVRRFLGEKEQFRHGWELLQREVIAGRAAEVHQARERFVAAFRKRAELLRHACELLRFASRVSGQEMPQTEELLAEAADLEQKRALLESRWHTPEDLEDLVAESYPLPAARLKAIAARNPPPQSWYDEECRPF
jgi:hypothetical protein